MIYQNACSGQLSQKPAAWRALKTTAAVFQSFVRPSIAGLKGRDSRRKKRKETKRPETGKKCRGEKRRKAK